MHTGEDHKLGHLHGEGIIRTQVHAALMFRSVSTQCCLLCVQPGALRANCQREKIVLHYSETTKQLIFYGKAMLFVRDRTRSLFAAFLDGGHHATYL